MLTAGGGYANLTAILARPEAGVRSWRVAHGLAPASNLDAQADGKDTGNALPACRAPARGRRFPKIVIQIG